MRPDVRKMVHGYRVRRHQHHRNPFRLRNLPKLAEKDFAKYARRAVPSVMLHSFTRQPDTDGEADEESLDDNFEEEPRPARPAATPTRQIPTPILPQSSRSKIVQALLKDHYRHTRNKMERTLSPHSDREDNALDSYRRKIARSLMPYLIEKAENDPRLPKLLHDEWLKLSTQRKKKADQITNKGTYVNLQRSRELEHQERIVPEEVVAARNQEVRKMLKSPSERMQKAELISKKGTYQNLKKARELLQQRKLVPKEVVTARNQQVKRMLEVGENYGQLKESSYKYQVPLTSDCKKICCAIFMFAYFPELSIILSCRHKGGFSREGARQSTSSSSRFRCEKSQEDSAVFEREPYQRQSDDLRSTSQHQSFIHHAADDAWR